MKREKEEKGKITIRKEKIKELSKLLSETIMILNFNDKNKNIYSAHYPEDTFEGLLERVGDLGIQAQSSKHEYDILKYEYVINMKRRKFLERCLKCYIDCFGKIPIKDEQEEI